MSPWPTLKPDAVRLGNCLKRAGATVRVASLPLLDGSKCGVDDLLVAKGAAALLWALPAASPLEASLGGVAIEEDRKALAISAFDAARDQPDSPLIAVRGPKGSEKIKILLMTRTC